MEYLGRIPGVIVRRGRAGSGTHLEGSCGLAVMVVRVCHGGVGVGVWGDVELGVRSVVVRLMTMVHGVVLSMMVVVVMIMR